MRAAFAIACIALGVHGGCAHRHDFEVRATNTGETPVDMQIRHMTASGASAVMMDTTIAPGATSWYHYDARLDRRVSCEVVFEAEDAMARLEAPSGVEMIVDVEEQDGLIVVTNRSE